MPYTHQPSIQYSWKHWYFQHFCSWGAVTFYTSYFISVYINRVIYIYVYLYIHILIYLVIYIHTCPQWSSMIVMLTFYYNSYLTSLSERSSFRMPKLEKLFGIWKSMKHLQWYGFSSAEACGRFLMYSKWLNCS